MSSDHFTPLAQHYAAFRPNYPDALFDWLADCAPSRGMAWDCGAGSGQATVPLAAHFDQVVATDISAAQLAAAPPLANVEYRVAPAEDSGLPDACCDLVTVAQAMHWFDLPRFHTEVRRVLKPQGVIAVWGYNRLLLGNEALQQVLDTFYEDTIGAWWPPERVHVENGYRDLPFPWIPLDAPRFTLQQSWTCEQLRGYLRSWSAVGRFMAEKGYDPVDEVVETLAPLWPRGTVRCVEWPLFVRAGRNT